VNFTRDEMKRLALPLLIAAALLAAGIGVIWSANGARLSAARALAASQGERKQALERLARISEEEREVTDKLAFYQRLKSLNILGEERRLEWADAIGRIRAERELLDLKYTVERQKLIHSYPAKPSTVDFYASTMKVALALLHEEDLLRFLSDLRASGYAYYAVRKCALTRTGQTASGTSMTPRLRGECEIDLITIVDRGAKR
jgi:hypothetical protein